MGRRRKGWPHDRRMVVVKQTMTNHRMIELGILTYGNVENLNFRRSGQIVE